MHSLKLTNGFDPITVDVGETVSHLDQHRPVGALPDVPLHTRAGEVEGRLIGWLRGENHLGH